MTNEQYLVASYFTVGVFSLGIGAGVYARLRKPLEDYLSALAWSAVREALSRVFPAGILLPALLGFVTVAYRGCKHERYSEIIADRPYLEHKNMEQIGATLKYLLWAVVVWSLVLAVLAALKQRNERGRSL